MEGSSIQSHEGDYVREALNRHYFEDRIAHGYVEDEEVLVTAEIERDKVGKLFVHAGGELEEYKPGIGPDYTGGTYYGTGFENVHELEEEFNRLVEEYDLHVYDQEREP